MNQAHPLTSLNTARLPLAHGSLPPCPSGWAQEISRGWGECTVGGEDAPMTQGMRWIDQAYAVTSVCEEFCSRFMIHSRKKKRTDDRINLLELLDRVF